MKVLFTTHPLSFQHPGGGEQVILSLHQSLKDLGVAVKFFNPWEDKIRDYDIIHEFHSKQWQDWFYYKTQPAKLVVTPTLWPSVHPLDQLKYRTKMGLKNLFGQKQTVQKALELPDLFLPTTKTEMGRIQSHYQVSPPFEVIPNGVHEPLAAESPDYWLKKLKIKEYFLFVGNISPIKNLLPLIRIFNQLEAPLLIVGGHHPDFHSYAQSCKEQANDNIYFLGPLDHDQQELNNAYYGAKGVIVPSLFETCSLVGLESTIRGIPLLMTKTGATQEIYQDYVSYLDPNDHESMKQSIISFINYSPETDRLKIHIKENHSWPKIAKQLKGTYQKLLE